MTCVGPALEDVQYWSEVKGPSGLLLKGWASPMVDRMR